MVARVAAVALTALALATSVRAADAHPLHTTLTEISITASSRVLRATVRLFADDLTSGLSRRRASVQSDADVTAYISAALSLRDGSRAVATRGCGVRRTGELLWVCLEGSIDGSLDGVTARNAVLCEMFPDQVNIVQVTAGSTKRSVLFTRGDGAKRLF